MCSGAETALLAAMMAGGTYMTMDAQADAADRQQALINDSLAEQDAMSRKAEQVAMDNAKEYTPETRLGRFLDARTKAGDSLVQDLTVAREQQGLSGKGQQASGRLSQDFLTGSAAAAADEYQRSVDMARKAGNMRGVADMLADEGQMGADYALQGGMLGSQARRQARAAEPGIMAAGRPHQNQMFFGSLLSGMGSAGMAGAGRKSTTGSGGKVTAGGQGYAWD